MQPKLVETNTGKIRQVCIDCGEPFDRDPGEVEARRGTGLPVSPRCPGCRITRRDERNASVFESLRSGDLGNVRATVVGPDEGGERLYPADCSGCQRPIRLPFKPRLDRPVFCRFCLDARSGR
ncbi:MAG: hypothetical protein H0V00_18045 [Chloroflexia bacterium]|nr:hypothetical protein [Chloroflexia bacterium]